jgi:hypothetical protein
MDKYAFEPGWLMKTGHDAHIRCMADHSPASLSHLSKTVTPIPASEAMELYAMMNARFKQWTGLDLSQMSSPNPAALHGNAPCDRRTEWHDISR